MDGREDSNLVYGMLFGLDGSGLDSDVLAVVGLRGVFACLRLCVTYNTLGGTIPTLIISGNGD